jgi:hypothetical protein
MVWQNYVRMGLRWQAFGRENQLSSVASLINVVRPEFDRKDVIHKALDNFQCLVCIAKGSTSTHPSFRVWDCDPSTFGLRDKKERLLFRRVLTFLDTVYCANLPPVHHWTPPKINEEMPGKNIYNQEFDLAGSYFVRHFGYSSRNACKEKESEITKEL